MADPDHRIDSAATAGAVYADTVGQTPGESDGSTGQVPVGDRNHGEALVGQWVADRYDVISVLGSGGIGVVYLARDLALDELVALKLLNPAFGASAAMTDLLQREVKLARRVTHRNVSRTFDFAQHDGQPFLTMEYIQGAPLSSLISKQGALAPLEAIPILAAVCAGLRAAHDAGIMHRDIKPDNIMIGNDGRVVVTDFGLARGTVDDGRAPGQFSGTPRYMSPEQVLGQPASIRSDLFSLGIVAYELLSGALPWHGDTPREEADARLHVDPEALADIASRVGAPVSRVVMRALTREPAGRFPSAALFSEALLDAVPGARSIATLIPSSSLIGNRAPSLDQRPTIAVLPFDNRGKAADDHLAQGFSEDLIDSVSELSKLRVLSLGASTRVLGTLDGTPEPHEVGRQLGVDLVIAGWVERAGDDVRVRVRVIDVHDGFQRWSHRYQRPLNELLTISADIAQELSAGSLDEAQSRQEPMPTADAMELYLRGREAYRFPGRADEAAALFTDALRHAPNSPLINAGLAIALLRQWMMLDSDPGDLARRAAQAAQRAIDVAPQLGEPYQAQAFVRMHQGDIVGAVRGLRDAIARAPSLADAHGQLGAMLVEMGRVDEGRKRLDTARRLDPTLSFLVEGRRGRLLQGDWGALDQLMEQARASELSVIGTLQLVRFCSYGRRLDDIRWVRDQLSNEPADSFGIGAVVRGLAGFYLGELPFEPIFNALTAGIVNKNVSARRFSFAMQLKAELAGFAGRTEIVLDAVCAADEKSLIDLLWLDFCPLLDALREEPGFAPIRDRIVARVDTAYDALWS